MPPSLDDLFRAFRDGRGDVVWADFLDVLRDPANLPVLVHCYRGVHRTGSYVAVYRIEFEGWSVEKALEEMVDLGYDILPQHADVRGYFASYKRTGKYALSLRAGNP